MIQLAKKVIYIVCATILLFFAVIPLIVAAPATSVAPTAPATSIISAPSAVVPVTHSGNRNDASHSSHNSDASGTSGAGGDINNSDGAADATVFGADSAECSQSADGGNVCIYLDDASFIDKNAKLWAPTIKVYRDISNKIIKVVALAAGSTKAHYVGMTGDKADKKSAAQKKKPATASADIITIHPAKNLVVLEGGAQITAQQDTIVGSHLEYDSAKQTVFSQPQKEPEFTTIVIHSTEREKLP